MFFYIRLYYPNRWLNVTSTGTAHLNAIPDPMIYVNHTDYSVLTTYMNKKMFLNVNKISDSTTKIYILKLTNQTFYHWFLTLLVCFVCKYIINYLKATQPLASRMWAPNDKGH
jgi:hypothetical protein